MPNRRISKNWYLSDIFSPRNIRVRTRTYSHRISFDQARIINVVKKPDAPKRQNLMQEKRWCKTVVNIFVLLRWWFLQVLTTSSAMFCWHSTLSHQISRQAFMKTVATRKLEQEIRSISIAIVEFYLGSFIFFSLPPYLNTFFYSSCASNTSSLFHL